jgi:hypothetical protein
MIIQQLSKGQRRKMKLFRGKEEEKHTRFCDRYISKYYIDHEAIFIKISLLSMDI